MAKTPVRGRAASGTGRQRSVAAAARAAAKRAEQARRSGTREDPPEHTFAQRRGVSGQPSPKNGASKTTAPATEQAAEAAAAAPGASEAAQAPRRRSFVRSGALSALLAGLTVAGLVAAALLGWQYREAEQTRQARTEALATARKAAPVVLSYDYRHLDRDFAAARGYLTGPFLGKYRKTTKAVVEPTARKYSGVVKATVAKPPAGGTAAASVVSASPDRVVVLLFVNQITHSSRVAAPRLDLNRVRMTLVKTSDGWKVNALDAL